MPPTSAPARALTTKQAKAAYKARNGTSLSEREKKQLQRSVELDRRAWRAQEVEKRKAEAAKKRAEKERKEREERVKAQMGSQRRCDKFGYMSSQMHLGAFMKKAAVADGMEIMVRENEVDAEFGDDEVDDETLLGMLADSNDRPPAANLVKPQAERKTTQALPLSTDHHDLSRPVFVRRENPVAISDDLDSFWDELGSSTQIARELSVVEPQKQEQVPRSTPTSFSSDEFDFTAEDLAELEPPASTTVKAKQDRALMPPPPLPKKPSAAEPILQKPTTSKQQLTASFSSPALDFGFTMSQLAEVAAEDIQLTQDDPT